jgi:hypothetical protein
MNQPGYPPYGSPYGPPPGGGYGPPPGGPQFPIPPGPPTKKKSPIGLIIGLVVGLVLVVGIGVGAFLFLKGRGKSPGLPVDAKYMPTSTKEVGTRLIESTREPNEQIKAVYLASELGSQLCRPGFGDPARRIEGIGGSSSQRAKELFFNKKRIDDVQQLLECGAVLGAQLESPYAGFLAFEDDQSKRKDTVIMQIKVSEIPGKFGFTKQSFGSMRGFCRTQAEDKDAKLGDTVEDKGGECKDTSHGAFPNETTWFLGDKASLDLLAKTVAKPREELGANVTAIKEAAAATDGLPVVRLAGNPKSSKEYFLAPCYWASFQTSAGFTNFVDGCFPSKALEKSLVEVDSKIRAAAYEMDSDYQKAGAIVGNIVFVARDAEGAKVLEKDIKEIVSDWKAHLDTNDGKLIKETKDKAYTHSQKKFAAVVDRFFDALHKMTVTQSGRTVRISYNDKLSAEDIQGLEDADKKTVEKRLATAQILEAVQAKKAIPEKSLAKLVGAKWATYLLGPPPADLAPPVKLPLTADECKVAQRQIAPIKLSDMTTKESKDLYMLVKYATCTIRPPEVLPVQKGCLAKFKTASDFMMCAPLATTPTNEPPEDEFGDNAAKKK